MHYLIKQLNHILFPSLPVIFSLFTEFLSTWLMKTCLASFLHLLQNEKPQPGQRGGRYRWEQTLAFTTAEGDLVSLFYILCSANRQNQRDTTFLFPPRLKESPFLLEHRSQPPSDGYTWWTPGWRKAASTSWSWILVIKQDHWRLKFVLSR